MNCRIDYDTLDANHPWPDDEESEGELNGVHIVLVGSKMQ